MKPAVLDKIIARKPDDVVLTVWLSQELDRISTIRSRIAALKSNIETTKKRHQSELSTLNNGITLVQSDCKHEDLTYYPDAAGGSDSFHVCNICGKDDL